MKAKNPDTGLNQKREAFCQAFVRLGVGSDAYINAGYSYKTKTKKSIHEAASRLLKEGKVSARIEELQKEVAERNKITIDELVKDLAGMVRFDIAQMYNADGTLKSIHEMSPQARAMITEIDTFEEYSGTGNKRKLVGHTKSLKIIKKLDAVEKLMKHLGGYKKDNEQKKPEILINWSEERTYEAPKK